MRGYRRDIFCWELVGWVGYEQTSFTHSTIPHNNTLGEWKVENDNNNIPMKMGLLGILLCCTPLSFLCPSYWWIVVLAARTGDFLSLKYTVHCRYTFLWRSMLVPLKWEIFFHQRILAHNSQKDLWKMKKVLSNRLREYFCLWPAVWRVLLKYLFTVLFDMFDIFRREKCSS